MKADNWFKAATSEDRSGDILVSFDPSWLNALRSGSIKYVLRRRYPKTFVPQQMYLYVGRPHSKLIGFARVLALRDVTHSQAALLERHTGLTTEQLNTYFGKYGKLGCYVLSSVTLYAEPLTYVQLREQSGFSPPQSFVALSRRASEWLRTIRAMEWSKP